MWTELQRAVRGNKVAAGNVAVALAKDFFPAATLLEWAVARAGTASERTLIDAHRDDRVWNRYLPLTLQEFPLIFGQTPAYDTAISSAEPLRHWAAGHVEALKARRRGAARRLQRDLQVIAAQAAETVTKLGRLRREVRPPLHILRVQALGRAREALGTLTGKRALEVGSEAGALMQALTGEGMEVWGNELNPTGHDPRVVAGDFMTAKVPGSLDLIVATAVFEWGSGWPHHHPGAGRELLARLASLLRGGGVAVIENIGFPMPFTKAEAGLAGFDSVPQFIPAANHVHGGRGATLRRR